MDFPFVIDIKQAEQITHWWNEGRGITHWRSLDLSNVSESWIYPTDNGKPNWKAGDPKQLTPDQIGVETQTRLEYPDDWFPECPHCQGKGERSLQSMADIWGCSLLEALEKTKDTSFWRWAQVVDGYFKCNCCEGSGRERSNRLVTVKVVRLPPYKGGGLHAEETQKIVKMRDRLRKHYDVPHSVQIEWTWDYVDHPGSPVYFFTSQTVPLSSIM